VLILPKSGPARQIEGHDLVFDGIQMVVTARIARRTGAQPVGAGFILEARAAIPPSTAREHRDGPGDFVSRRRWTCTIIQTRTGQGDVSGSNGLDYFRWLQFFDALRLKVPKRGSAAIIQSCRRQFARTATNLLRSTAKAGSEDLADFNYPYDHTPRSAGAGKARDEWGRLPRI